MKPSVQNNLTNQGHTKEALRFIKAYFWQSPERTKAMLFLAGALLCMCSCIALTVFLSWWNIGFWASLTAMSVPLFMSSMKIFAVLITAYTGISALQDYCLQRLALNLRNFLTQQFINKYASQNKNNYLELSRHPLQIEHPEQRIQEDVSKFVEHTLSLGINFLNSTLTLAFFIGTLWVLSSVMSFVVLGANITIPGLLVWAAILFASISGVLTHKIGHSLATASHTQKNLEADFRQNIAQLNTDAESVAQDHGETYYKQSFNTKFQTIINNSHQIINIKTKLTAFKSFYQQISSVFPYIIAAPLYFARKINLTQFMNIGFSFSMVQMSLDWFLDSYESIAKYKASLTRLAALDHALEDDGIHTTPRNIVVQKGTSNELRVQNLNIAYPSSTQYILRQLNLTFKPNEHVLIQGRSGLGKSTLLKVLAGAWRYGHGTVFTPSIGHLSFLPQQPSIPCDTLKSILAYPKPVSTYTHEEYVAALRLVHNMDPFIAELDVLPSTPWFKRLSGGQRQRISFARALLHKPEWLLLDEATSALGAEDAEYLYPLIKQKLNNTTLISIAHHASIAKFHDKIITLEANTETVREQVTLIKSTTASGGR